MKMNARLFLTVFSTSLGLSLLTSCASIKVGGGSYEPEKVQQIRSAALVGVEVVEPEAFDPLKPSGKIAGSGNTMMGNMKSSIAEPAEGKAPYYKNMHDFLKKNLKWNMVEMQAVTRNPVNKEFYKNTSSGFQQKSMIDYREGNFTVPDVMDFDAVKQIGQSGREKLMDALKVDALVSYRVHVTLSGTTVMGIGSMYPQSILQFQVYKRGIEKPVWEDLQAEGVPGEESIGKTRLTLDVSKLNEEGIASAETAYPVLLKNREKNTKK